MKQLIKNELIKLRAQKTYVVLSCIVLALVAIVSFFTSVLITPLNNLILHQEDIFTKSAAYEWAIDKIEENPDGALASVLRVIFKDPKSEGDEYREHAQEALENEYMASHAYNMAQATYYDFKNDHDLPAWIDEAVHNQLTGLYEWRQVYEGIENGLYTEVHIKNDWGLFYVLTRFDQTDNYMRFDMQQEYDPETEMYTATFYRYDDFGLAQECSWSDVWAELALLKPACDAWIAQTEQYALTLEPDSYYDSLIQTKQAEIMNYQNQIERCEQSIAELDEKGELTDWDRSRYELEIEHCRGMIEDHERVIDAYGYLKEQGASPDSNAFALVNRLYPAVLESRRYTIRSFNQSEINGDFILLTKAQQSGFKHEIRVLDKALVAIEYAYTNDILPEDLSPSGAKSTFISNLSTASFLISAVTVVLASMILSREFATGTVRLWVIRPRTRTKLLGSKIATLFIYVCTMMGASFVITYAFALVNHLVDLFFYGQSTLFVSNYGVVFGKTVAIPAIAEHLWAPVILTLPVILYAMLCLFISVLSKKGVLSIVCGMLVLMFATDIQALALIVANYTGVFGYALQATVLPYLSMDRLLVTALDFGVATMSSLDGLGALMGLETMVMSQIWGAAPYVCSTFVGAGVLLVHILLLVWASLFAFNRTQIKS